MSSAGRSGAVAEFVLGLRWAEVPADVQAIARSCLVDLAGCAIAGGRTEVARATAEHALEVHGPGAATIIGRTATTRPAGAALANGFAASALDLDDGFRPVKGHAGAVVVPAAIAAADQAGAAGPEFMAAVVAGYEVALRAGQLLHRHYAYYHGSGAWGPIGAAVAAGRLLGLDAGQLWNALGIAEFHGALTPEMRSVDRPSMLKDGIGWGAFSGFSAALLAGRDFSGVPSLFDAEPDGLAHAQSLGREYLLRRIYFKPYACCRWAQPAVEAVRELAAAHRFDAGDVDEIRVHTFEEATHLNTTAPLSSEEAQFSLPWPVACMLLDGEVGPDQVLGAALLDARYRRLAGRVRMAVDPDLDREFPDRALARVEVLLSGGARHVSAAMEAPGDHTAPLPAERIDRKFARLVAPVFGPEATGALLQATRGLEVAASVSAWARLLRGAGLPEGVVARLEC